MTKKYFKIFKKYYFMHKSIKVQLTKNE